MAKDSIPVSNFPAGSFVITGTSSKATDTVVVDFTDPDKADNAIDLIVNKYKEKLYYINRIEGDNAKDFIFLLGIIAYFGSDSITGEEFEKLLKPCNLTLEKLYRYNILKPYSSYIRFPENKPFIMWENFADILTRYFHLVLVFSNKVTTKGQIVKYFYNEMIKKYKDKLGDIAPFKLRSTKTKTTVIDNKPSKQEILNKIKAATHISLYPENYFLPSQIKLRKDIFTNLPIFSWMKQSTRRLKYLQEDIATLMAVQYLAQIEDTTIRFDENNDDQLSNAELSTLIEPHGYKVGRNLRDYKYVSSANMSKPFLLDNEFVSSTSAFDDIWLDDDDADPLSASKRYFKCINHFGIRNERGRGYTESIQRFIAYTDSEMNNRKISVERAYMVFTHLRRILYLQDTNPAAFNHKFFLPKEVYRTFELLSVEDKMVKYVIDWIAHAKSELFGK